MEKPEETTVAAHTRKKAGRKPLPEDLPRVYQPLTLSQQERKNFNQGGGIINSGRLTKIFYIGGIKQNFVQAPEMHFSESPGMFLIYIKELTMAE